MITPEIGSSHHSWKTTSVMIAVGMPSRKPKKKPKLTMNLSSLRPIVEEDPVGELRVLLEVADHHQLDVQQVVDVVADLRR